MNDNNDKCTTNNSTDTNNDDRKPEATTAATTTEDKTAAATTEDTPPPKHQCVSWPPTWDYTEQLACSSLCLNHWKTKSTLLQKQIAPLEQEVTNANHALLDTWLLACTGELWQNVITPYSNTPNHTLKFASSRLKNIITEHLENHLSAHFNLYYEYIADFEQFTTNLGLIKITNTPEFAFDLSSANMPCTKHRFHKLFPPWKFFIRN